MKSMSFIQKLDIEFNLYLTIYLAEFLTPIKQKSFARKAPSSADFQLLDNS
jgi:hypothetical protein